jgi:hypothetical protein
MSTIKITLFESATNVMHEVQVPDTITGQAIIEAMLKTGKLSRTDSHGHETDYFLVKKESNSSICRLNNRTLSEAGVVHGDTLTITSEIIC